MPETLTQEGFAALNVPSSLLNRLQRAQIVTPTPIQQQAIPVAMTGVDLVGIAQTGTGKTLAFGLPMVAKLQPGQVGLVIAPTRELAEQIAETFKKLGATCALLIGGDSMGRQVSQLRMRPSVIVATPGRLEDHLARQTITLDRVTVLVLDEADRMFDLGFAPAIRRIVAQAPKQRQTMLFSATMPPAIAELAATYLDKPVRIDIRPESTVAEGVDQELLMVRKEDKPDTLRDLLAEHRGTILVFARTRHGARKIAQSIRNLGHTAAELHADRTPAQRRFALEGFKRGVHRVLVATDIAARGIDVKEIALVINYDVPENPADYVHRIGRTGRAGKKGRAIMLATPEQHGDVRDIEKLLRTKLPLSPRSSVKVEVPRIAPRPSNPKPFKRRRAGGFAHQRPR
ncbi:MAG: DEAD/DEAH box helicase [Fimbriimonadaceae bacterium]|nr:DEAD/DEAH box helicase [Fimbriimonadaceae bacterium]